MALSPEKRAQVQALAKEIGVDPDELIAEAEDLSPAPAEKEAEPSPTKDAAPAGEVKIFAYHLPYLTTAEVRKSIGFDPSGVPEPNMPTGQWLAKYGGGSTDSGGTPPKEE
jgi:hypothetical protein